MKYLIAITLPNKIDRKIRKVQQKYKSTRWNIALPPHITIMPPVEAVASVKTTINVIKEATKFLDKFQIEILGVNFFRNRNYVIYAAVYPDQNLVNLYEKISSCSSKIGKIDKQFKKFIPHITLSNKLTEAEFNQKYQQIKKIPFNSKFICDKISLFVKNDSDKEYRVIGEVKLGE